MTYWIFQLLYVCSFCKVSICVGLSYSDILYNLESILTSLGWGNNFISIVFGGIL